MSALAERTMVRDRSTNGRHAAVVVEEPRTLTPYERLEALCDPGSLHVIRSTVLPRRESKRMQPGDGVVGARGTDRRPAGLLLRAGPDVRRRLAGRGARRDHRARDAARRPSRAPVIGFVASGGARMDDGIAALGGYGRIFRESVKLAAASRRSRSSPACRPAAGPTRPRSPTSWR